MSALQTSRRWSWEVLARLKPPYSVFDHNRVPPYNDCKRPRLDLCLSNCVQRQKNSRGPLDKLQVLGCASEASPAGSPTSSVVVVLPSLVYEPKDYASCQVSTSLFPPFLPNTLIASIPHELSAGKTWRIGVVKPQFYCLCPLFCLSIFSRDWVSEGWKSPQRLLVFMAQPESYCIELDLITKLSQRRISEKSCQRKEGTGRENEKAKAIWYAVRMCTISAAHLPAQKKMKAAKAHELFQSGPRAKVTPLSISIGSSSNWIRGK